MKRSVRVAKMELSTLFYSPIAWFLLIVLLFQCGLVYTSVLDGQVTGQQLGRDLSFLTRKIFGYPAGLFYSMISKIYLYLPLLTMGLISREISSGTIKLLYSSPLKVRHIVFGKFLAMMAYNLLLLLILGLFVLSGAIVIKGTDPGLLFSGLLGIYLLLCTYSAIGLFMSCLTSYQVVAAISTLVVFGILSYIGTMWQDIDFVRDLTYFISISGRTENMLNGLISSKDCLYFLLITGMFLAFSIYKLLGDRETKPGYIKAGRYVLIVVCTLLIGYVSSRPGAIGYYDATAGKANTLSVNVQQIIKGMDKGPVEVTSYINLLEGHYGYGSPAQRNMDMARWERYLRFKPDMQFKYVYYYDTADAYIFKSNPGLSLKDIASKTALTYKADFSRFLGPGQIRKRINLKPEENRYVMQLKYQGKTTFLRLYDDMQVFPGETETAAALKRLTTKLPKIGFLEGQLERSIDKTGDRDYKQLTNQTHFRYALVNQGFDVANISLKDGDSIPDVAALVIADPKTDFDTITLARLRQYITRGGNLLIAGEPGKQSVLNPLLRPLGVSIMDGILVQKSKDNAPDLVLPSLTETAAALSPTLRMAFEDSIRVSMPGVAGLSYDNTGGFEVRPLLMTDGKLTWIKKGKLTVDSADVVFDPAGGDEKAVVPTALALTRKINGKEQRIVVTGDGDFMSNTELRRWNVKTANFYFNTALFGWFSYGQFPIDAARPKPTDTHLNITLSGVTRLKYLFLAILPGLLLIAGAVFLIRRKRK